MDELIAYWQSTQNKWEEIKYKWKDSIREFFEKEYWEE